MADASGPTRTHVQGWIALTQKSVPGSLTYTEDTVEWEPTWHRSLQVVKATASSNAPENEQTER